MFHQYREQKKKHIKKIAVVFTFFITVCLCGCASKEAEDITVIPQPTQTSMMELTITPTHASTVESTLTPTLTPMVDPTLTSTPIPTAEPTLTPTPTVEPTPTPLPTVVPTEQPEVTAGKIVAIDAGHQGKGNYEKEPLGPGSTELKAKVSSGTQGISTGVPEYELTLAIYLQLRDALLERGYEVIMIRETNDVNISNAERAAVANASADIFLRIHADGSTNTEAHGISVLYPSANNPFVAYLHEESEALSAAVLEQMCENTGAKKRGIIERDDLTGINWCEIPVALIEMGFMTNPAEDEKMQTTEYQALLVEGICDGVDAYFER